MLPRPRMEDTTTIILYPHTMLLHATGPTTLLNSSNSLELMLWRVVLPTGKHLATPTPARVALVVRRLQTPTGSASLPAGNFTWGPLGIACFPCLDAPHHLLHTIIPPHLVWPLHCFPYPASILPDLHAIMLEGRGGGEEGQLEEEKPTGTMFLLCQM